MKTPPIVLSPIVTLINNWIRGEKLNKGSINAIQKFYQLLDIKHRANRKVYRGLQLSPKGFEKFMTTGKLNLKKRLSESWSCQYSTASKFANHDYGVIIFNTIPKNKIIIDIEEFYKKYVGNPNNSMALDTLLGRIKYYSECEIITNSICTKCDVKNALIINFTLDGYMRTVNSEELVKNFSEYQSVDDTVKYFIEHGRLRGGDRIKPDDVVNYKLNRVGRTKWTLLDR